MHSPCQKPRRWLTHKEKGKKKVSDSSTDRNESDRCEFESEGTGDRSSKVKSASTEKASTTANERLRRSSRQKNPVVRFGYNEYTAHHYAYMTRVVEVREPESYAEAAKDANWSTAMEKEMHALAENETWDLVDAPKGVKPIRCRWVYKVKYNTDSSVNRYKARLAAKGYAQKHGIDYDETFAPVAKMMIIRVLLAVAAAWWPVRRARTSGEAESDIVIGIYLLFGGTDPVQL